MTAQLWISHGNWFGENITLCSNSEFSDDGKWFCTKILTKHEQLQRRKDCPGNGCQEHLLRWDSSLNFSSFTMLNAFNGYEITNHSNWRFNDSKFLVWLNHNRLMFLRIIVMWAVVWWFKFQNGNDGKLSEFKLIWISELESNIDVIFCSKILLKLLKETYIWPFDEQSIFFIWESKCVKTCNISKILS